MAMSVLDEAPAELAQDIALKDGVLIISDARKGDQLMMDFISLAKRRHISRWMFVPAESFRREFGTYSQKTVEASDVQQYAIDLIHTAVEKKATDIHLVDRGSYGLIQFRCLGMLQDYTKVTGQFLVQLASVLYSTLCSSKSNPIFTKGLRLDARISRREFLPQKLHSIRIHTECIECAESEDSQGVFMLLRLLADLTEAKGSLESRLISLGYREFDVGCFRQLVERTGLVVIGGPVGSGKSTTLKHVMEACSQEYPEKSYMSVEDPPEFPMANVKQSLVHTGNDSAEGDDSKVREQAYLNAIGGLVRSDSNMVMIGEIRYPQAAFAAIDVAQTDHAVWTTLHAPSAFGIIKRLRSMLDMIHVGSPLEYLCDYNIIAGLVYQRLVPLLCPHCKMPLLPYADSGKSNDFKRQELVLPSRIRERLLSVIPDDKWEQIKIRGEGCAHCNHMGIVGQSVVAEVVVTDDQLLRFFYENKIEKAYDYWLNVLNGQTFIEHAKQGIAGGILDPYLTELRLGVPLNFTRSRAAS